MRGKVSKLLTMVLCLTMMGLFFSKPLAAGDVPRITKEKLKGLLGNPDVIVLDVRSIEDWQNNRFKIKGAAREIPGKFDLWANKYPQEKTLVLY